MDIWDIVRRIFLSFLVIEGMVIHQMHAQGEDNLDYVIVLGARVRGAKISNSLKQRLDRAIEYSEEYPNTVLVLSGGKVRARRSARRGRCTNIYSTTGFRRISC